MIIDVEGELLLAVEYWVVGAFLTDSGAVVPS
jgi:hypothetical protein